GLTELNAPSLREVQRTCIVQSGSYSWRKGWRSGICCNLVGHEEGFINAAVFIHQAGPVWNRVVIGPYDLVTRSHIGQRIWTENGSGGSFVNVDGPCKWHESSPYVL